jgi:hypothetical protein
MLLLSSFSPLRLLASGLSAEECAAVVTAATEVTGAEFQVSFAAGAKHRVVLLEGFNEDPSLAYISEQLDAELETPLLVAGCPAWSEEASATATVDSAVANHITAYGLRDPIAVDTEWEPHSAQLVSHWALDGAIIETGPARQRWDVSEVAVWDGVVDEALRDSLLSLLRGPSWDAEAGADPRLWERGTFTDVSADVEEEEGAQGGGGWGLSLEAIEALCAEPPPPAIAELQARIALLLGTANDDSTSVCRMAGAVFGDEITPLSANAPVADDGDLFGW